MTKQQRIYQRNSRIMYACMILVTLIAIICKVSLSMQTQTYAIPSESNNGTHYKYVTEYSLDATYIGNNKFLDANGNAWLVKDNLHYQKGKSYTLVMHDNGTENDIYDDVIIEIN